MVGSYILLISLPEGETISFGRRHQTYFKRGYYAYVGSAMGGLESRINRHRKLNKKLHWHIDYLLEKTALTGIILGESQRRIECAVAQALHSHLDSIPHFGSSDCRCPSHLFFATNQRKLRMTIVATLNSLGIKPQFIA